MKELEIITPQPSRNLGKIIFTCHTGGEDGHLEEILSIDATGMTYKGQRVEDAGEAHRAFLDMLDQMRTRQE